ncbi:MAG: HD domain-containing phosphohydrolase [Planctomycetota bacterium]|jgi:response regulator RpfG family c-di-GMP phosphodiesterase
MANGTILVVEDEADLRFLLTVHLRAEGFDVLEAEDGLAAIAMATESKPDLVIMDVGLPQMDGIAATASLKNDEQTSGIPIIMLTARSATADVVRGLEAGAQEYLSKPFDMTELVARVRSVFNLTSAHRDLDELNQSLEAQVDLKTKRLQVLYDFMRVLNRATDREAIAKSIIESVEELTNARRISVLLRDRSGQQLICERAVGIDPDIVDQINIKPPEGIAGQVFTRRKMLSAVAITGDQKSSLNQVSEPFLSTPLMSTSMQSDNAVFGVLNITDKDDGATFTEEEIECIRSIADAAAIALNNVERREWQEESVTILLRTLGHLAEYRDEETTRHLERVSIMARVLSEAILADSPYSSQMSTEFVEMIVQAAPMHDIGKVGIPDEILTKPGKLTDEEFQIMKTHTEIGRRVLSKAFDPSHPAPLLQMCIDITHCHHERYNGTGYPRRIKGTDIPLAARVISLVDAYDAITSHRRYSKARTHNEAVRIIKEDAGSHFDPVIVDVFLRIHEKFRAISRDYAEAYSLDPIEIA